MSAVVIEHVSVSELPEAWRSKLTIPADAHVTVRIEDEATAQQAGTDAGAGQDLLFGMWRDREDMADVEGYVRKLRAPRYKRDGSRNDDQG